MTHEQFEQAMKLEQLLAKAEAKLDGVELTEEDLEIWEAAANG